MLYMYFFEKIPVFMLFVFVNFQSIFFFATWATSTWFFYLHHKIMFTSTSQNTRVERVWRKVKDNVFINLVPHYNILSTFCKFGGSVSGDGVTFAVDCSLGRKGRLFELDRFEQQSSNWTCCVWTNIFSTGDSIQMRKIFATASSF